MKNQTMAIAVSKQITVKHKGKAVSLQKYSVFLVEGLTFLFGISWITVKHGKILEWVISTHSSQVKASASSCRPIAASGTSCCTSSARPSSASSGSCCARDDPIRHVQCKDTGDGHTGLSCCFLVRFMQHYGSLLLYSSNSHKTQAKSALLLVGFRLFMGRVACSSLSLLNSHETQAKSALLLVGPRFF